jgi:hypothetical protein
MPTSPTSHILKFYCWDVSGALCCWVLGGWGAWGAGDMLPIPPNQASIPMLIMTIRTHSTNFAKARRLRKTFNNGYPLRILLDQAPILF